MPDLVQYKPYIKYGIVGLTGALLQVAMLFVWVSILGLRAHYIWGVVIGFLVALSLTFPLQKLWTFQDTSRKKAPLQFVSYTIIAIISLGLNTGALSLIKRVLENMHIDFFQFWYLVAEAGIVVCIAAMSFLCNRFFTFIDRAAEEAR